MQQLLRTGDRRPIVTFLVQIGDQKCSTFAPPVQPTTFALGPRADALHPDRFAAQGRAVAHEGALGLAQLGERLRGVLPHLSVTRAPIAPNLSAGLVPAPCRRCGPPNVSRNSARSPSSADLGGLHQSATRHEKRAQEGAACSG